MKKIRYYPAVFHPEAEGYSVSIPDIEDASPRETPWKKQWKWRRMPSG